MYVCVYMCVFSEVNPYIFSVFEKITKDHMVKDQKRKNQKVDMKYHRKKL